MLMKRFFTLILTLSLLFSLCACQENFSKVDLKEPIAIGEDGTVAQQLLTQIKQENAICVFTGESNGLHYEWTVFGSDISAPTEINLGLQVTKTAEGDIQLTLLQPKAFGFSAPLSVFLDTEWTAQSATAYDGDKAVAAVSLTGSKTTVLNLTLDGSVGTLVIRPDPLPQSDGADDSSVSDTSGDPAAAADTSADTDTSATPENSGGKDKYHTDPIPEGKPKPAEPEDQEVNTATAYTCTFSIECSTILNNLSQLDEDKLEMVPSGGVILPATTVTFYEGESVFDVLQRVCRENGIHMESSWTPMYNSAYIEGIHNLYEFDCGSLSGWMYRVNGWYPNYGCSRYQLQDGDTAEWRYTCDLGNDVGGKNLF